jgi:(R,R)-butanediol dehydrogenase/meso-butanediol dehydrogenase/diacetyl reductase
MRAAVFHGQGDVRVETVADPACGPGELLLEVSAVGICGTDAHEYRSGPHMFPIDVRHPVSGHLGPMIPGHELAGVVREAAPDVVGFASGDLVVSGAGISCGECVQCRRGRTNLCQVYSTIGLQQNGALAELVAVPANICVNVEGTGLTPDAAALAQPMAIAVHAMRRGRLTPNDEVVVLGAGGIGAFLTFAACQTASTVAVFDLDDERLRIADDLGATHVARIGDVDPAAALQEWGIEPTVVYEVSGTVAGLRSALSLQTKGARIVMVGLQGADYALEARRFSLEEQELIGTNAHVCGADLPEAVRLLALREGGWSDVAPRALSLDDLVGEGLKPLAEGRSTRIKTLIDPRAAQSRPTHMRSAQTVAEASS